MGHKILLKDIVIPKGTIFTQAPHKTERNDEHYDCLVGLSKNTCGDFTYCIDKDCTDELEDYFTDVK
jgi:hypothetical protein